MLRLRPEVGGLGDLVPHTEVPDEEPELGLHVQLLVVVQGVHRVPEGHPAVGALTMSLEMGVVGIRKTNVIPDHRCGVPEG